LAWSEDFAILTAVCVRVLTEKPLESKFGVVNHGELAVHLSVFLAPKDTGLWIPMVH
jgi:hypothetical protein